MKMLRIKGVIEKTGIPRSSVYRKIQRGEFPKPVKLGLNTVAWPEQDIDAWLQERISESMNT